MKNIFVLSFIAAILASISSISYAAPATTTGQVKFKGNIIESTCTASSDTVKMETYLTRDITKRKGAEVRGSKKDFKIKLTGCPVTIPLLMDVKFSGSNKDTHDTRLLALDTSGAAGIGIGLYNDKDAQIDLSSDLLKQDVSIDAANMEISLKAAYVSNGQDIKAGVANATLSFVIHYK
ncbi:fimbrial protein [Xenorhabdus koppenhoeferi]|uniref:Major type 1 subunit fimbrin (Pilin) n=1 Tax=Xenorhabdus koppenhoeferi TaxID=351659 RepID=A0A1I7JA11_9GAMM|nr:fimbrial protein [Xenorhabdus koppenhoeferi]SFU82040.1 major type 1 subunit fimbrin (pilin) [Xenorhabdus koppenhoeferi]